MKPIDQAVSTPFGVRRAAEKAADRQQDERVVRRVEGQSIGHVKVKQHRPVRGTIKQFSVTRQGRKWFVNARRAPDSPVA